MRLNSALLDLDGTLLDTLGDFTVSLNAMLADLKLPSLSEEQVETLIGRGSEHLIRGALTLHCPGLSGDDLDQRQVEGWRLYQAHYRAHNGLHSRVRLRLPLVIIQVEARLGLLPQPLLLVQQRDEL